MRENWLIAGVVLASGVLPCALVCLRADVVSALAALNLAGILVLALLMMLSVAFRRQPFIDLAVVLAPLSMCGLLAFVRFLERRG